MGVLLSQVEKYAIFSPLVVLFDQEAVEWSKYSLKLASSSTLSSLVSNDLNQLMNSSSGFAKTILKETHLIRRLISQILNMLTTLSLKDRENPALNNTQYYCDKYRLIRSCFTDISSSSSASSASSSSASSSSSSSTFPSPALSSAIMGRDKQSIHFTWSERKKYCEWLLSLCSVFSQMPQTTNIYNTHQSLSSSSSSSNSPMQRGRKN
jgi:hypothetical protein